MEETDEPTSVSNLHSAGIRDDGEPLPESALAQIFGAVSDRASRQGGKVIDIGEIFIRAMAGEDTITGEAGFEAASGLSVDELVAAVRESAREQGVEADDAMHLRIVDKIEQKDNATGFADGSFAYAQGGHRAPEPVAMSLLHEAAHVAAFGQGDEHVHGDLWRRVYLGALGSVMGPDVAAREAERVAGRYADEE